MAELNQSISDSIDDPLNEGSTVSDSGGSDSSTEKPPSFVDRIPLEEFDRFDLSLIDTIDIEQLAKNTGMSVSELSEAADLGLFPPWAAGISPERGWIFNPDLTRKKINSHRRAGYVFVPVLEEDLATITLAWLDTLPEASERRCQLFHWFRCADPEPLEATRMQLVWWCCHFLSPSDDGVAPTAPIVGLRWESVYAWYEMLTEAGIGHSSPHLGTSVSIIVDDTANEWSIFEPDIIQSPRNELQ